MKTMWLDNNLNLSKPTITKTKNPNSALDIIKINNDEMIMVFNNHFLRRNNLSIAYSNNKGKDWDSIYVLEQAKVKFMDFSYPYMLFDGSRYHIFYSYKKKTIKHVWFSKEWIRNKIKLSSTNKPEVSQ
jgi:predicted neuraminidase